jgi:1-acyl-sn-glycerol-3-phosphate acyltransferase
VREGDLLAIFPEGVLTLDGKLQEFKGGIMKILEREPVPVIPMALANLWGSYFSRVDQGNAMVRPFRRGMFSRIGLQVGQQLSAHEVQPKVLQAHIAGLLSRA